LKGFSRSVAPVGNDSVFHGAHSFRPSSEVLDGASVFGEIQQSFFRKIESPARTFIPAEAIRI
jgi:hypothetical protein